VDSNREKAEPFKKQNAAAMNKGLVTLLSVLFFSTGLFAQPVTTTCVDFEQFPAGLLFGPIVGISPGDVILGEEGLSVSLEEISLSNGQIEFQNASINDDNFGGLEGNYFFMGNNSVLLDFSTAEGAVQEVCFDFVDGGGEENFSVNGSPVTITQDFSEIADLDIPGVTITVSSGGTSNLSGSVCLSGNIESLLVGGQELGIDNVCFGTNTDCGILNLEAEVLECYEDGSYDLEINFVHLSTTSELVGFDVLINGQQEAYLEPGTELPYTLAGVLPANGGDGEVVLNNAPSTITNFPYSLALFGPGIPNGGLTGNVVEAFDDTADSTFICEGVMNQGAVAGNIALVDRGGCPFEEKAKDAEAAGAIGLIICNFENELIEMAGLDNIDDPSIPTIMLEASTCAAIRQFLQSQEVEMTIQSASEAFELTVCENDNPDCCSTISVEPDCPNDPPSDCIGFEGLESGGVYGSSSNTQPGTTFYDEEDVGLFLLPFQTLFWTTTYGDLNVLNTANNPEMTAAVGNHLQFESVNAVFDLTGYSEPIDSITLDFYYTGGGINIAANGAAFLIQNNLEAGFYALAPGITVQVVYNMGSITEGQLLFTGNIQSLLVGGQGDFRVDNLCINPTEICEIENLTLEALPCNPNNEFSVELDFDFSGSTSDTFRLLIGNNLEGYYAYDDLPITIGPIQGPTDTIAFEVVDYNDDNCSAETVLLPVDCDNCPLEAIEVLQQPECLNVGVPFYFTVLEVIGAQAGDTLQIASEVSGLTEVVIYNGQELALEFPATSAGYDELQICLLNTSASAFCCVDIQFDVGCPTCEITDLVLEPFCDGDSLFYFDIDFETAGIFSDTFVLDLENGFHAEFAYDDLPVTLGPIVSTGENLFVWLFDDTGECGINTYFQTPDCEDGCVLGEVSSPVVAAGCNNDGTYNIPLNIENAQIGDLFFVQSQLTNYADTISYGMLGAPVLQLSNWPVPGEQFDELLICLWDQPNCCVEYTVSVPCNEPCGLVADVQLLSCEPNGLMTFEVTTTTTGTNNAPYIGVVIAGQFYGLYGAGSTVEVGQIVNDGSFDILDVEVQLWEDFTGASCSVTVPVDVSNCASDCEIPGFEVSVGGCSGFGAYQAILEFDIDSLANQTVDIYTNGELTISDYIPASIVLDVLPYNPGTSPDVITVCYSQDPDCCESIAITPPNCNCSNITNAEVEVGPCSANNDGTYSITVGLEVDEDYGQEFYLETSNGFFGTFLFSDFPVTIGGLVGLGESVNILVYQDGECEPVSIAYVEPDCSPVCELPLVEAYVDVDCSTGLGILFMEFYDVPAAGGWYSVDIPEANITNEFFLNGPTTISYDIPIPSSGAAVTLDIIICSLDAPNCCEVYTVSYACPPCDISVASNTPVATDCFGDFYSNTLFVTGLAPGDTVNVISTVTNSSGGGVVNNNGEAIIFYNFLIPPNNVDVLEICSVQEPNCCTLYTVEVDCDYNCEVYDAIWNYECNNDGTFSIVVDSVLVDGDPQGPFTLATNGYGSVTFEESQLPLEYGPFDFDPNQNNVYFQIVSAGCDGIFEAEFVPDCNIAGCLFTSVIAEPYGCNDGQFMVDVQVEVNDPGILGYYIIADGQLFGAYGYNQTFVTIGPFEGDGSTIYDLVILDIEDPSCFGYAEVGPVECEDDPCAINDLQVTTLDCTNAGTYGVIIDFNTNAPDNSTFSVYGSNGQQLGFYPMFALPVTIQGIDPNNTGVNEITVCLDNSTNCCASQTILEPACPGDCAIYDVAVELAYCDTSGFYVQLSFEFDDPAANTYTVFGNGETYGTFSYNEPQPVIGPFDPFTDNIYELIVQDTEDAECSDFVEFPAFDCPANCDIIDLAINTEGCDEEGNYAIVVDFEVENPGNDFFEVYDANGILLGFYPIAELPVLIEGIEPTPNDTAAYFNVCINDMPDCCAYTFVSLPDCTEECAIYDVAAEFVECDTAGFYMQLSFEVNNPAADGYQVVGNGINYGVFGYNEPFPVLGPFESIDSFVYELIVTDLENSDCSGFVGFESIDCEEIITEECLALEEVDTQVFSPETGYVDGDLLFSTPEAEVYLDEVDDNCSNCQVAIAEAANFPNFPVADGHVMELQSAGVAFHFGNTNGLTRQVTMDFSLSDTIWVAVNGNTYQQLFLVNGQYDLGNGVAMVVNYNPFVEYGNITFTGPVEILRLFSLNEFPIDNICVSEFEDNSNCIEFAAFNGATLDTINLSGYTVNGMYLEEDDVIITSTAINWYNQPNYFNNVYATGFDQVCALDSEGGKLLIDGGVNFDYTMLAQQPTSITFDLGICISSNNANHVYLEINQDVFLGHPSNLPTSVGGVLVEAVSVSSGVWQFTLTGTVEHFTIGGVYLGLDNICFSTEEEIDDCVTFSTYDGISDTIFLADYAQPYDFFYEEDNVHFTASAITYNNNQNYFGGIIAYAESQCGFDTDGAYLYVSGALDMDFTDVGPTANVSFDFATCFNTGVVIRLSVNGDVYEGTIANLPNTLGGVGLEATPSLVLSQWAFQLEGAVETLSIGAVGFSIDNICFGEQQVISEVWPGDANNDNIAHHVDLLNIGLAYGEEGPFRAIDGTGWIGVESMDWDSSFANGINYKHADCNGDGLVNIDDRAAIAQNYGLTHGPATEIESLPFTDLDPPIFVDFEAEMPESATFNVPIIAGTEESPIENIYGLAFTVEFDPELLPPGSIQVVYPTSWFGEPNVNSISIDRTYAQEGILEIAMTRTDGNNVSGYGEIAYIIGIIDDIAGLKHEAEISISRVKAIDKYERRMPLNTPTMEFRVIGKGGKGELANGIFTLYPNPTSDWVTVGSRHGFEAEELTLMSVGGHVLKVPQEGNNRISLENVPAGTYILRIRSGKTQVHKFIVRQ